MVTDVDASGQGNGGGYEYHFVALLSEGSDLVCKICYLPSRNPHLSSCCGHTFCKSCINNLKEITEVFSKACPVCRDSTFPVIQNKQIDRAVRSLHVYCTNEKEGCKWQGEINDIVGHVNCCQYEDVKCTNSSCGNIVQRRFLQNHMNFECAYRDLSCWRCLLKGTYLFIEGQHKDECPNSPLPCPNRCEVGTVFRKDLDAHREICSLEMIKCEYYDIGCEAEIARKDIKDHNRENVDKHLHALKRELACTKKDLLQAQKDLATAEKGMVDMQKNFQKQINDIEYQCQQNIKGLETHLYNTIHQLHKNCHPWTLKLNALATMSTSGEQVVPVVLKMTNFAKFKKEKEWWYSDPFYTHRKEYKMRLLVCAAGDNNGEGTFVSVWLSLLNGHDEKELPLKGKIKLYNQISNKEHHRVTVECCNNDGTRTVADTNWAAFREWRNPCFISHNDLTEVSNTRNFLKNDCLFFWVFVKIHSTVTPEELPQPEPLFSHKEDMHSPAPMQENQCLHNTHDDTIDDDMESPHEEYVGISDDVQQKPCPPKEHSCVTDDEKVEKDVLFHALLLLVATCMHC